MAALDTFFNLGNKATGGDPLRKAQFDYYLYWIVFISFLSIAINDFYQFFFMSGGINTLMWGIIVLVFCWFNYYALGAFRGVYENMKRFKNQKPINTPLKVNKDNSDVEEMLNEFKN